MKKAYTSPKTTEILIDGEAIQCTILSMSGTTGGAAGVRGRSGLFDEDGCDE